MHKVILKNTGKSFQVCRQTLKIRNSFGYQYSSKPRMPPAMIILIGPILKTIDATTAAANSPQLIQSGKFSLTMLISGTSPFQSTENIRIRAAAPISPTTAGLRLPRTLAKTRLFLNFV